MTFKMQVEGLKEIDKALGDLPKATAKAVLRRILTKRGQPIAESMRSNAPVHDGSYKASIKVSTKLSKRQRALARKEGLDDVNVYVGAGEPQSHLIEHGTKPRKHKKTGKSTGSMPARPHIRPAWDKHKGALLDDIGKDIWAEIDATAKRLAKRAAKK